jgi:hypothetical protein
MWAKSANLARVRPFASITCDDSLEPDGTARILSLRSACASLHRRARQDFPLSLPRLPAKNRLDLQRCSLFSARRGRRDGGRGQGVQTLVGQRLRRCLSLLPCMRVVALVGARAPSPSGRHRRGRVCRSRFSGSGTGRMVRRSAFMVRTSARDRFASAKPGARRPARIKCPDAIDSAAISAASSCRLRHSPRRVSTGSSARAATHPCRHRSLRPRRAALRSRRSRRCRA